MPYVRRNHPPAYPKLRITNLTNQVLYVGIKTANVAGVYLAPNGQTGDRITLLGVDLTDKNTVNVLTTLARLDKILVEQVGDFYTSYQVTTSTTSGT